MSRYDVELSDRFKKEFRELDGYTQKIIRGWINKTLVETDNPRIHGKALTGNLAGLWRYRIGDYRLIAEIKDDKLSILAISIGHRREIYR